MRPRPDPARRRRAGSALIVTLLLLGILAVLTVSALRSATLDLAMSGNEWYRARALAAAEAGLAAGLAALAAAPPGTTPAPLAAQPMPGQPEDRWSLALRDAGDDPETAAANAGARHGRHYTLASTGTSLRGARVSVESGVLVVRDAAGNLLGIERRDWKRTDVD